MHCIKESFNKQRLGKDKATIPFCRDFTVSVYAQTTGPESNTTKSVKINPIPLVLVTVKYILFIMVLLMVEKTECVWH